MLKHAKIVPASIKMVMNLTLETIDLFLSYRTLTEFLKNWYIIELILSSSIKFCVHSNMGSPSSALQNMRC